jgi:hypothetical protein
MTLRLQQKAVYTAVSVDLARQFTLGHDKIKHILEIDPKIRTIAAQLGAFMMPQAPSTSSGKN